MLVMFSCILIGFAFRKTKLAPDNAASVMSKLEVNLFLPAQVLNTFITNCTVKSISAKYSVILYGTLAIAVALELVFQHPNYFLKTRING